MKGYDYNILLTVFYVPYIFFEIPSNVACKYFGPKIWIPFLCLGFGVSVEMRTEIDFFGGGWVVFMFVAGMWRKAFAPLWPPLTCSTCLKPMRGLRC